MHVYFHIFNKNIPGYSLMIILGMIVANIIAIFRVRKYKLDINDFIILEGYVLLGALLGAKGLYLFVTRKSIEWNRFFEPEYFNSLMRGGFVFYGGLILGFTAFVIAGKLYKINYKAYLNTLIFLVPLVHGFGRIGCFLAGCCYGIPYKGIFSVTFPQTSFAPSGISLFPIQLCEAFCLFILAFIVWYYSRETTKASPAVIYFMGYSIIRFFTEFLRYDNNERGYLGALSTSQWISIAIFVVIIVMERLGCLSLVKECKKVRR